jgi:hypothetical protein
MLFGVGGQILTAEGETAENNIRDYFDSNISMMTEAYYNCSGTRWKPGAVESVKKINDDVGQH